MQINQLKSQD